MEISKIPEEKIKIAPKDFFLWAGAMVAFYASVIAFINLIFRYIDYVFPNPLNDYQVDPYQSGISGFMATVIVAFPIFLVLMRIIRRLIVANPMRQEIWIRRWALFLTLFVAGSTIAGTLIVLLTTFLSGEELTARFLLKILTVFIVASAVFAHFLADIKGYWKMHPDRARNLGFAVAVVVAVAIIAGFFIVGTPRQARLARFDSQRVSDLQNIQWQIVSYWQQKQKLPGTLNDLADPISGFSVPFDPQTKEAYEYKEIAPLSFQLCAAFNMEGRQMMDGFGMSRPYPTMPVAIKGEGIDNWQHGLGHACFERTIDPERYPPQKLTQ